MIWYSLDEAFVNTPEEQKELQDLIELGVDITRPLEEQSKQAQQAWRDYNMSKGGNVTYVEAEKFDPVANPKHYVTDPSGIECIQITRHRNFNIGNAIKYLWRAGLKASDATEQDLRKAIFYIEDEIGRMKGNTEGYGR